MGNRVCKICGKEITEPYRKNYCSKECMLEANRRRARGNFVLPPLGETVCPICHKKFKKKTRKQIVCSEECRHEANTRLRFIKGRIKDIAIDFGFDVQNEDRIVSAKLKFFGDNNMRRCPCDADNPDRYCGSALCIHDVVEYGHCHCRLFWLKEKKDEKL